MEEFKICITQASEELTPKTSNHVFHYSSFGFVIYHRHLKHNSCFKFHPFFNLQTKQSGYKVHSPPLVLLKPGFSQAMPVLWEHTQDPLCFCQELCAQVGSQLLLRLLTWWWPHKGGFWQRALVCSGCLLSSSTWEGRRGRGGIQYFTALRGGEGRRENVENPCNTRGPLLNIAKAAGNQLNI